MTHHVKTRVASEAATEQPPSETIRSLRRVAARSRTQEVTDILRTSILNGELEPGSMHSIGALAETLGVSRTPVREALIELASRGMVRFQRNRGVRILQASPQDVQDIFQLRRLLEVPAAQMATARMTPDILQRLRGIVAEQQLAAARNDESRQWELDRAFHHALLAASGNRRLADYVDQLRDAILVRRATTVGLTPKGKGVGSDHLQILEAFEAHDADRAAAAVASHLDHTLEMLISQEDGAGPISPAPSARARKRVTPEAALSVSKAKRRTRAK
jgi:DNA-binding GntR family transcriptional regulator